MTATIIAKQSFSGGGVIFRLLENDFRKLSYFVLSIPFPNILPVSYTEPTDPLSIFQR